MSDTTDDTSGAVESPSAAEREEEARALLDAALAQQLSPDDRVRFLTTRALVEKDVARAEALVREALTLAGEGPLRPLVTHALVEVLDTAGRDVEALDLLLALRAAGGQSGAIAAAEVARRTGTREDALLAANAVDALLRESAADPDGKLAQRVRDALLSKPPHQRTK